MKVGVRELRNNTAGVIEAVRSGVRVTLTSRGEEIADIVPHRARSRWAAGSRLRDQLATRSADAALARELDETAGQTLDG